MPKNNLSLFHFFGNLKTLENLSFSVVDDCLGLSVESLLH